MNKTYIIDSLILHETEPKKEEGFGLPTAHFSKTFFLEDCFTIRYANNRASIKYFRLLQLFPKLSTENWKEKRNKIKRSLISHEPKKEVDLGLPTVFDWQVSSGFYDQIR